MDVLIPGHGQPCNLDYIPEMSKTIQSWVDAVTSAIAKGWSMEEAQAKISLLDQYPEGVIGGPMKEMMQKMNIRRLYEILRTS